VQQNLEPSVGGTMPAAAAAQRPVIGAPRLQQQQRAPQPVRVAPGRYPVQTYPRPVQAYPRPLPPRKLRPYPEPTPTHKQHPPY